MSTSPIGASMPAHRRSRLFLRCLTALALVVPGLAVLAPLAAAATVSNLSLSGDAGTVLVGTALYAKQGGALTLSAITTSDTQCVQLTGAFTSRQTNSAGHATWTFALTAGFGDGVRTVT
jgi:hypothetical protein